MSTPTATQPTRNDEIADLLDLLVDTFSELSHLVRGGAPTTTPTTATGVVASLRAFPSPLEQRALNNAEVLKQLREQGNDCWRRATMMMRTFDLTGRRRVVSRREYSAIALTVINDKGISYNPRGLTTWGYVDGLERGVSDTVQKRWVSTKGLKYLRDLGLDVSDEFAE